MPQRLYVVVWVSFELRLRTRSLPMFEEIVLKRFFLLVGFMGLSACVSNYEPVDTRNSSLTQGSVQMNVIEGKTTKAEILEIFGAPNITTRDSSGTEVWTYQRAGQAAQSSSNSGGWTVLFERSYEQSGFSSSSRMMTLIIKFSLNDIVSDFSSRTSNF